MKTFKNANAKNTNCDSTRILFAQSENIPQNGTWLECDELELTESGVYSLFVQAGVRYFGYL